MNRKTLVVTAILAALALAQTPVQSASEANAGAVPTGTEATSGRKPLSRRLHDSEHNAVISALDTNRDGVLKQDELSIASADLRRRLDANNNGQLEAPEVKAG